MNFLGKLKGKAGLAVLIAVCAIALVRVLTLQSRVSEISGVKTIRIAHWQMEAGVRDALELVAREYEKIHPDVRIQQIVIGERGYGSWITTRLIGGTAPDLVAMGAMDRRMMLPLLQRYFIPLSEEIAKPNLYNNGTPLEGVPWKLSFYDNMEGGAASGASSGGCYIPELMDYYRVPSSAFTLRMFYNKSLLREATGLEAPPSDFRGFIATCEKIKAYGRSKGVWLYPIAGTASKYNTKFLWGRFDQAVSSTLINVTDVNRDSDLSAEESVIALVGGAVGFRDPRIRAMIQGKEYYRAQFQPAFFAADRMDAAFLFLQQKALMIASGSWDAGSYAQQADFEIGVCDFPLPSRDDPEFGKFVEGPAAEELQGDFSFSVNSTTPHRAEALDFMRFLTSQKMNAVLNDRANWIPMVRGNRPGKFIAAFLPHPEGVKEGIRIDLSGRNLPRYEELINLVAAGRLDFDGFVEKYTKKFVENADDWMRVDRARNVRLAAQQDEFALNSERAAPLPGADRASVILQGILVRDFENTEYAKRYDEARARTPLPTPSK